MALSFVLGLGLGSAQPIIMSLLYEASPPGRQGEAVGIAHLAPQRQPHPHPARLGRRCRRSPGWRRCSGCSPRFSSAAPGSRARQNKISAAMKRVTLTQFLVASQRDKKLINADLRLLIETSRAPARRSARASNKGALADGLGSAGNRERAGRGRRRSSTCSSNEILLEANEWGGHLAALASEEMDDPQPIPTHYPQGEYLLLFDPLDGSSNIDVNVSVGTIFSVLRCPKTATASTATRRAGVPAAGPQPGRRRLRGLRPDHACSCSRSATASHGFTLDRETCTFVLTHPRHPHPRRTRRNSRSTCPTCATGTRR